jgi:hypothetical protein
VDYNIIIMAQPVKKYHHSVHLPSKNYNGITVTNAAHLNGTTYISTSSKHNPIMKFSVNENGGLNENPTTVPGFSNIKIKFIGFIKDKIAVIPKYNSNIYILDQQDCSQSDRQNDKLSRHIRLVTVDSQPNLKQHIVSSILNEYPKSCRCEDCYHLLGFAEFRNFNFFIQLSCNHKPDHKLLFVVKANINTASLECTDLEATNEYDYYRLFIDQGLSEKYARSAEFTSVHYDGSKVYLVSTYGKEGHLWEMPYFGNISYLGPPSFVTKLRRQPKGIYSSGQNLIVVCRNIGNQRMNYYLIAR